MKAGLGDETMGLGRWNRGVVIVKAGDGRETVRDGRCEGLEDKGDQGEPFWTRGETAKAKGPWECVADREVSGGQGTNNRGTVWGTSWG